MIVGFSILGGVAAVFLIPRFIAWQPYDYVVYMQGARMVREGLNPHALLPYWYPLPIVLFTTMPWSFLPDTFAWAFAFIPLGLLHIYYGRDTVIWWLFFPLLINVAYAQVEGWLIFPLIWLLVDRVAWASSIGVLTLMFKPAYGFFLIPYYLWRWWQEGRYQYLKWLMGLGGVMLGLATLVEPTWPLQWFNGVIFRHENAALIERNMTVWAFVSRGGWWLLVLPFVLLALFYLVRSLWSFEEARGEVLLALSLFFFPGGLNPVSSMMVMPLIRQRADIMILVGASWLAAALDVVVGGFGGVYLSIVLVALALRLRQLGKNSRLVL